MRALTSPYQNIRQRQKEKQDKIYSVLRQEVRNVQQGLEIKARDYEKMEKVNNMHKSARKKNLKILDDASEAKASVPSKKEQWYASLIMYNSY
jgi:hypothetical protein